MRYLENTRLLVNTIKYLRPVQIIYQTEIRIKRRKNRELFWKYKKRNIGYQEYSLWVDGLDNDPTFMERFKPKEILNNRLTLINETRELGRWVYNDASHLWNFNVHYLEYLIPLVSAWKESGEDRYLEKLYQIFDDWYQVGSMETDSNHAYTISLRVINQLIIEDYVKDKQKLYDSIYAQYRFLINHQEKHLMGNHYFENLKAIVICSVIFREENIYKEFINKLLKELKEEITADGMHFELSLMYHKIILEDLIRVAIVLRQAEKEEYEYIVGYIGKMCSALYSLEAGISRTLLFNDAGDNVAKPTVSLLSVCKELFGISPEKLKQVSGYYVLNDGKITVVEDCGNLSPSYMPGHAHCDCLSFELFYNGLPVFVNSGTFQYQGEFRQYFRSTKAHNTVVINGHEQSELWGEHRAGRRISVLNSMQLDNKTVGIYKNCFDEKHKRTLQLTNGTLLIKDVVSGTAESYIHLAPGFRVSGNKIEGNGLEIKMSANDTNCRVESAVYADEFGKVVDIECIVFSWDGDGKERVFCFEINEE